MIGKEREETSIFIDYENINVEDIMNQIKKKIADEPHRFTPSQPSGPEKYESPSFPTAEPEEIGGLKAKIKRILLKIMKPFSPLIKLLVFPVHYELRETIRNLHQTNQRLDFINYKLERELQRLDEVTSQRIGEVHSRLDSAYETLHRATEYIKLLHNLSHNLVVELSKLKIEEEHLKSKTRIMEKDFEFLNQRERALERELLK